MSATSLKAEPRNRNLQLFTNLCLFITDVQFLQYPNDRNRSIEINSYADPQLTSEAIQA